MEINPRVLQGTWRYGWALDLQTLSSVPLGNNAFATTRTPMGEALYRLKYEEDRTPLADIVTTTVDFLRTRIITPGLAAIVPVPPSNTERRWQPVAVIAQGVGQAFALPVYPDTLVKTRATPPLKNIEHQAERDALLAGAFQCVSEVLRGRWVLLFDDLYRSGTTMREATSALVQQGGVGRVYTLTLTRTRTLR